MRKVKRFLSMSVKILLLVAGLAVLVLLSARLLTGAESSFPNFFPGRTYLPGGWQSSSGRACGGMAPPRRCCRTGWRPPQRSIMPGRWKFLLMSGDNRFIEYNEPAVMREVALSLGVPDEAIVLDFAGRRTYDTCYRARDIFLVEEAILVTQAFHMPRALYLCNQLGVDGVGVEADGHAYRRSTVLYWNLRELLATVNALWEVHVSHPLPVLGEQEPIFKEPQP